MAEIRGQSTVIVAAAQASPVFLDLDATIEKACVWIREAARNAAQLIVFPEAFVPAYPDWVWAVPPGESDVLSSLYAQLLDNAIDIPSSATDRLCQAAAEAGIHVVIGVNERNAEASGGSLYNTLLTIDNGGNLLGKHRKLVPTSAERLVWAHGDGSTLQAYRTSIGTLGGLICWENYMPLARYAMYAWGTEIYAAATWDRGDTWLATLRHIAKEGGMIVVGCCMALRKDDLPPELRERFYAGGPEWINVGGSAIVDPNGTIVAGPSTMKEEILYAEIDRAAIVGARRMLDVAGHYGRPDVFELTVHRNPRPMMQVDDSSDRHLSSTPRVTPALQ